MTRTFKSICFDWISFISSRRIAETTKARRQEAKVRSPMRKRRLVGKKVLDVSKLTFNEHNFGASLNGLF